MLDLAAPTASGDFGTVINAIYALNTQQGPAALSLISGQSYSGFSSAATQGSQLFMNSFQANAGGGSSAGSSGGGNAGLPGSTYVALRADADTADACDIACDVRARVGRGMAPSAASARSRATPMPAALTYNLGGFAAGFDLRFGSNFMAGLAVGFNAASLTTQTVPGYGASNTLQFALYGEWADGPDYLDGLLGYARGDNP